MHLWMPGQLTRAGDMFQSNDDVPDYGGCHNQNFFQGKFFINFPFGKNENPIWKDTYIYQIKC